MHLAFRNVKRNRGAAGIDKDSIATFESNLEQNLLALMRRSEGRDLPTPPLATCPYSQGTGPDTPAGDPRRPRPRCSGGASAPPEPALRAAVSRRLLWLQAGRNCHMAVRKVLELHRQGHAHVLDADIKGFFDNFPHQVIMAGVAAEVADGNILDLVERFLKAGVMEEGVFQPTTVGTPQGGVISPLLANIALNSLDWHLHDAGYRFVRYADDFVVLCRTEAQVQEAHALVQQHLTSLGLTLSAEKTKMTKFREGFAFLGFAISSWSVTMRPKSVEKFKTKIRELTPRHHNLDARSSRNSTRSFGARRTISPPRFPTSATSFAAWTAGYACVSGA